jgi:hypothetical protein
MFNHRNTLTLLGITGGFLGGLYGYTENKNIFKYSVIGIGIALTAPISIPIYVLSEKMNSNSSDNKNI